MLVIVGIFAIYLRNMAYSFPTGSGIGERSPAAIAAKISGKDNGINLSISYVNFTIALAPFSIKI